jgi:hypothetical protein
MLREVGNSRAKGGNALRLITLFIAVTVFVFAGATIASQAIEHSALETARVAVDRALRVGSSEIIPKADLRSARIDEVHIVHHPVSMDPAYGLVPIRAESGRLVGLIGVDAGGTRCLWYNFHFPHDAFPPVSRSQAVGRLTASQRAIGLDGGMPEPALIEGCDKRIYWRFTAPSGESWLIDAVQADAAILGSAEATADRALAPTATAAKLGEPGLDPGGRIETEPQPALAALPPCYDIPGIPYHFQITSWYCGPSSLQMMMDYHGEEIGQHNIADVADDIVGSGTITSNMRRAAHFSGMSVAIQDSSLEGYPERKLGYACVDAAIISSPRQKLKNTVYAQYPVFVLTWFSGAHTAGHYRVVKGYDDSLDVFIMHDPWYYGSLCGPDLIVDQTFFVDDLWEYSSNWGMIVSPWLLWPTVENPISVGDTFTVDLDVYYPGPTRFGNSYLCTDCEATISLSPGLSLASGSATLSLPDMVSDDTVYVSWEVIADGPEGDLGMSFQAQGILTSSSASYPAYSDSIGGHAYETVTVGSTLLAGWDAEERLTFGDGSSQTCLPGGRAMVMADDGTVHIVWADTRDDASEIYYRKKYAGVWESEVRLTDNPSYSYGPCVALGPDGVLHVAWADWRDGNQEIYYKAWDPEGGWSLDERVTNYAEIDCSPALAAGDTAVYLAWERRQGGAYRTAAVMFAYRTAAGWTAPLDVDASPARDSYRPSLAMGVDGILHLVYERQTANTPDENERIVHQTYNGLTWSGRTGISGTTSFSRNPCVAAGPDSTVHLVWHDGENVNTDIFYAMYDGLSWQPVEQIVVGGFETATPSVAADGFGNVHVAWSDHRHGETEIHAVTREDIGWGMDTRITRATGASILPSVAAGAQGSVSIVWTDLRHGNADLYFIESEPGSDVPVTVPVAHGSHLVYLERPYPTPFSAEARVAFTLAEGAEVSLEVFDVRGRLVRALARRHYSAGKHSITWDGRDGTGGAAASGIYFIRCATAADRQVRRAVLVR